MDKSYGHTGRNTAGTSKAHTEVRKKLQKTENKN